MISLFEKKGEMLMIAFTLPENVKNVLVVITIVVGVVVVGFLIYVWCWFARAVSGKDDTPQSPRFDDSPQIISEDD